MNELLIIAFLLIVGLGQLVLAFYLLGISQKLKSLLWLSKTNSVTGQGGKSLNIVRRAYDRAKDILVHAEMTGVKIRAESKLENRKITEEFAKEMTATGSKVEQVMLKAADQANGQFEAFLTDLKNRSANEEAEIAAESKRRVTEMVTNFGKEMTSAIDFDVSEVRKALASYKVSRMTALDANFLQVAQRAIEIIIAKKLTPADQTGLIYEALEQAKQEKLIS